jgi:hypothetical protein
MEGVVGMSKNYFFLEESPYQPGKWTIRINFDTLPPMYTEGSFNLLPARLLGLSYAEYLRYCRDVYGAEIIGKNNQYPIPYFNSNSSAGDLIRTLNTRMGLLIQKRGKL